MRPSPFFLAVSLGVLTILVAFWGTVGYVAFHFIAKFW